MHHFEASFIGVSGSQSVVHFHLNSRNRYYIGCIESGSATIAFFFKAIICNIICKRRLSLNCFRGGCMSLHLPILCDTQPGQDQLIQWNLFYSSPSHIIVLVHTSGKLVWPVWHHWQFPCSPYNLSAPCTTRVLLICGILSPFSMLVFSPIVAHASCLLW